MKTTTHPILVIDSDPAAAGRTLSLLQQYFPGLCLAGHVQSLAAAEQFLLAIRPDIILLDIELPDGNGFEFLQQHEDLHAGIIITTSNEQHAFKAIKASVLDYILKPVAEPELIRALNKALAHCHSETGREKDIAGQLSRLRDQLLVRKIKVPTVKGFLLADVDNLIRCEASDNYTTLFFNNTLPQTVSRTLGDYEAELRDYGFIRIHHKHLINIRQVTEYQKGKSGGGYVVMQDRKMLEVSVRKKEVLMHAIRRSG